MAFKEGVTFLTWANRSLTNEKRIFVYMMVIVPLAGELNFYPFNDNFRVSFGTPTFFFFLLWLRKIPPIVSGFVVGALVVVFRILIDLIFYSHELSDIIQARYPTFFYYIAFALIFYLTRVNRFHHRPILIGFLGILAEVTGSVAELTFQYIALDSTFTLRDLYKLFVIAIFRSFFVIGFFNLMNLREAKLKKEQIRKQNIHLLMITSNLYEETFQLKKTLIDTEIVTKKAYDLYRALKSFTVEGFPSPLSEEMCHRALSIAGEIHEVKKDNQRIFAGLSKLISDENFSEYMDIDELMKIVVQINKNYARLSRKEVRFILNIKDDHVHYHAYKILSIVNNVVGNAIEAIKKSGTITLSVHSERQWVVFKIGDDGPGISRKHRHLIFKPGFTTKYDLFGKPSTGIGLAYVAELIKDLEGEITLQTIPEVNGSVFTIRLPMDNLSDQQMEKTAPVRSGFAK